MPVKTAAAAAATSAYTFSYTHREEPDVNTADFPEDDAALSSVSALEHVRNLRKPTFEELLRRDPYAYHFWHYCGGMLGEAWQEWEQQEACSGSLPVLSHASILHPAVVQAFQEAWEDPSKEDEVQKL